MADAAAGTLPPVSFYKPEGDINQHPGYASVAPGDAHIADLVAKLQASPQYKHMVIVVTYDENGGQWDHVAPPKGDLLGPGTRIPAIIISPFAKNGTVDHTQYDTASILRLITRRFGSTRSRACRARRRARGQRRHGDGRPHQRAEPATSFGTPPRRALEGLRRPSVRVLAHLPLEAAANQPSAGPRAPAPGHAQRQKEKLS